MNKIYANLIVKMFYDILTYSATSPENYTKWQLQIPKKITLHSKTHRNHKYDADNVSLISGFRIIQEVPVNVEKR